MLTSLLIVIYIAFISLGLPDSILGSAWPVMQIDLGVPSSYAGIVTMIISAMTVLSSVLSDRITKRFGTGRVTSVSVLMTALALLGFSLSNHFWQLCVIAVPYGLGAGAIDAALNNFVALHYSSRHMSWLHMCWGIGAFTGPIVMGQILTHGYTWSRGYLVISVIQFVISVIVIASLPLWSKVSKSDSSDSSAGSEEEGPKKALSIRQTLTLPGAAFIFTAFLAYSGVEQTSILWASSFISEARGVSPEQAATYGSLFTIGITIGRFLSGVVSDRFGDRNMIRIGSGVIAFSILLIFLPASPVFAGAGLVLAGIGCGPVYPSIIHSTPVNFGAENSQAVIGMQMAFAYVGSTFAPPIFGLIAQHISISLFPAYLLFFLILLVVFTERLNKLVSRS